MAMIAIYFCLVGDGGLRYWSVEFIEHEFPPHWLIDLKIQGNVETNVFLVLCLKFWDFLLWKRNKFLKNSPDKKKQKQKLRIKFKGYWKFDKTHKKDISEYQWEEEWPILWRKTI